MPHTLEVLERVVPEMEVIIVESSVSSTINAVWTFSGPCVSSGVLCFFFVRCVLGCCAEEGRPEDM